MGPQNEPQVIDIGETQWAPKQMLSIEWHIPKVRQLVLPGFMGNAKWVVLEW